MSEHTYTINATQSQVEIIRDALECAARLKLGQTKTALQCIGVFPEPNSPCADACYDLDTAMPNDSNNTAQTVFDLMRSLRYRLAWDAVYAAGREIPEYPDMVSYRSPTGPRLNISKRFPEKNP